MVKRYECGTPGCGRMLTAERSVYSSHTGNRYCWPGEGCQRWTREKRRRMLLNHLIAEPSGSASTEAAGAGLAASADGAPDAPSQRKEGTMTTKVKTDASDKATAAGKASKNARRRQARAEVATPKASAPKASAPKSTSAPKASTPSSSKPPRGSVSAKEATIAVLGRQGKPMHVKDIVQAVLATDGVKLGGKTPEATIAAMLAVESKKDGGLFKRTKPATYTLRAKS